MLEKKLAWMKWSKSSAKLLWVQEKVSMFYKHISMINKEYLFVILQYLILYIEIGGYYANPVLLRHLITAYIPFLPLEKKHIKECIKDVLLRKKYYILREDIPEELVDKISKEMNYFPEETQLFSKTGCKRVSEKVDYAMDED